MTSETPAEYTKVCQVSDVPDGEGRPVTATGGPWRMKPMAVFNDGGNFYATNYVCPHMGGTLGAGTIRDGVVTCPWHGWMFNATTGQGERNAHTIATYELRVEGDDVLVGDVKSA